MRSLRVAACGGAGLLVLLLGAADVSASASHASRGCAPQRRWLVRWNQTFAARVVRPTAVYRGVGRGPFMHLGTTDAYGFATTVSVVERVQLCKRRWYRVRLAAWPNGATGWVPSTAVHTTRLRARIVVDVSRHRLFFYRRGKLVFASPAAIGKPSTPTPIGTFYVTQRFILTSTTGPYGPRALGISAFSNVLRSWVDGGPIGIHGTNETFSIGQPVSHGCVRLPNAAIIKLFGLTPLGTPVTVRP
jgi:lipoprotein-anchoring transpeptidase ErfK/SrfK